MAGFKPQASVPAWQYIFIGAGFYES